MQGYYGKQVDVMQVVKGMMDDKAQLEFSERSLRNICEQLKMDNTKLEQKAQDEQHKKQELALLLEEAIKNMKNNKRADEMIDMLEELRK